MGGFTHGHHKFTRNLVTDHQQCFAHDPGPIASFFKAASTPTLGEMRWLEKTKTAARATATS
jgi:hypothetical protein